jgi:hypothetical protein
LMQCARAYAATADNTRFQQGISVAKARAISGLEFLGCRLVTNSPTYS